MIFEMKSSDGKRVLRYWEDPTCHPTKAIMESMYDAGHKLYVDGKKQTKADAIKLMPKHYSINITTEAADNI